LGCARLGSYISPNGRAIDVDIPHNFHFPGREDQRRPQFRMADELVNFWREEASPNADRTECKQQDLQGLRFMNHTVWLAAQSISQDTVVPKVTQAFFQTSENHLSERFKTFSRKS